MYKKATNIQLTVEDFNCPIGMTIDPNNRWVRKAALIPWDILEERYACLFPGKKGVVAKPLRMALGSLLIQKTLGFSDRELVQQIKENPYLQYFIGLPGYAYKKPFAPSSLVAFRKRLSDTILAEINELIIAHNRPEPPSPRGCKKQVCLQEPTTDDQNCGVLILDATCAPQNIAFPQDTSLLNEARLKTEKLVRAVCKAEKQAVPRMYSKNARKDWLSFARRRKSRNIRKAIKKQLQYLYRDFKYLNELIKNGADLTPAQYKIKRTAERIYIQQKEMYQNHSHKVAHRIVSFSQPYIRPIIRGKAKSDVEFGVKLEISVVDGMSRVERMSFNAYNESSTLKAAVERYFQREGYYPERILADKLYRNRDNLRFCKEHGIKLLGPALGRPRKDQNIENKAEEYKDNTDRIEVERNFGLCKHSFGLGLLVTKLAKTTLGSVVLSVIAMNLDKLAKAFLSQNFLLPFTHVCIDYLNLERSTTLNDLTQAA